MENFTFLDGHWLFDIRRMGKYLMAIRQHFSYAFKLHIVLHFNQIMSERNSSYCNALRQEQNFREFSMKKLLFFTKWDVKKFGNIWQCCHDDFSKLDHSGKQNYQLLDEGRCGEKFLKPFNMGSFLHFGPIYSIGVSLPRK